MEQMFAEIFCVLVGKPSDLSVMMDYNRSGPTFTLRMKTLQDVADGFFVKRPDQYFEGELSKLIGKANSISIVRHRVAHGVVKPRIVHWTAEHGDLSREFRLVPPWYSSKKLSKPDLMYCYGSKEILEFAIAFNELEGHLTEYRDEIQAWI